MIGQIFSTTLYAAEETSKAQPSLIENIVPFLLIFAVMYFIIIRPQSKKVKEQAELLKNLKPGDEVVTSGGIIGRVKNISEEFISVDAGSTVLKVTKANVTRQMKEKAK